MPPAARPTNETKDVGGNSIRDVRRERLSMGVLRTYAGWGLRGNCNRHIVPFCIQLSPVTITRWQIATFFPDEWNKILVNELMRLHTLKSRLNIVVEARWKDQS